MNAFVLDLWHDLKQKRLWPVAAAMLAAIVAVPVLLSKPVADPGEPAPAPAADTGQAAQIPLVDLEAVPASSNLETFSAHNPFIPQKDQPKPAPGTAGTSGGASTGASTGGSGASTGGAAADAGTTGSTGGSSGDTGSTGSGSSQGGGKEFFTFEADLKFGPVGEEKKMPGVKSLDILPDEQNPALVFMGVTDDGKTALFMVLDPGLKASGEGKCEPSKKDCGFFELTIKDDQNEMLLDSSRGQDYGLQLTKITRVNIDEPAAKPEAEGARSSSKEKKDDDEPFFLPRLIQRAIGAE